MIVTAVDQKIAETMETQEATMRPNLNEDITRYSVQQAVSDLVKIHNSCSFMNGLRLALAEGTQSNTRRILTLRQTQAAAENAMKNACNGVAVNADGAPASTKTAGDFACGQATDRFTAITAALKTAEAAAN